jgi:RHS repeat-associated protein
LIGEQSQNGYRVYHPDFRGSTVMLTDSSGSVTDRYMYDAYGNLMNHSGSSDIPFLYNGQYGIMTDGNGLIYMRARYYNPEVRRFVSQDSIEGDIGNPLSLNLHTYCSNNPINYLDPTGHISVERSVYLYNMRFFDNDLGNRDWARNEIEKLNPFEQAQMVWIIKYIRAKENYVNSVIEYSGPYDAQAAADAFDVSMGYLGGEAVGGVFVITKGAGKVPNKVTDLAKDMKDWLGKDARVITNKNGDKVFISGDGTKRIRFDINNTSPHNNPHGHVEQLINGKWVKSGPIYPKDVPHN